jgi:hypothetical protein
MWRIHCAVLCRKAARRIVLGTLAVLSAILSFYPETELAQQQRNDCCFPRLAVHPVRTASAVLLSSHRSWPHHPQHQPE